MKYKINYGGSKPIIIPGSKQKSDLNPNNDNLYNDSLLSTLYKSHLINSDYKIQSNEEFKPDVEIQSNEEFKPDVELNQLFENLKNKKSDYYDEAKEYYNRGINEVYNEYKKKNNEFHTNYSNFFENYFKIYSNNDDFKEYLNNINVFRQYDTNIDIKFKNLGLENYKELMEYNTEFKKKNSINLIDWVVNKEQSNKFYQFIQSDKQFHIVTNHQLNNLIPKIKLIYDKNYLNIGDNYVTKRILPEDSKVIYLGDYHSSVHSLMIVIKQLKNRGILDKNYKLINNYYIVFLGDIVDRGPWGIECLYIIYLLFFINNQEEIKIYILNGNHEEKDLYNQYDFGKELEYQIKEESTISKFEELINYLPLALFIKMEKSNKDKYLESKWYQFCHGGIDSHQIDPMFIPRFKEFLDDNDTNILNLNYDNNDIKGFLWSDFGFKHPSRQIKDRPMYNDIEVEGVLDTFNIMTIISGHQDSTNYAFLLKNIYNKYIYDKIYAQNQLFTFQENTQPSEKFDNENVLIFDNIELNQEREQVRRGNIFSNINDDFNGGSNFPLNDNDNMEEEILVPFNQLQIRQGNNFINNNVEGEQDLVKESKLSLYFKKEEIMNMRDILASVMSSATISKNVPYSVYGILDLNTDVSVIVYLNPDFNI